MKVKKKYIETPFNPGRVCKSRTITSELNLVCCPVSLQSLTEIINILIQQAEEYAGHSFYKANPCIKFKISEFNGKDVTVPSPPANCREGDNNTYFTGCQKD